jgi:hypothetical protein
VACVDDELEAAELGQRAHRPTLDARDAFPVGRDGGRVDPQADHGITERASVRASSPAPRVVGFRRNEVSNARLASASFPAS